MDWIGNSKSIYTTLGASNHTDKEREMNDYYATDPIAIDALLEKCDLSKDTPVWECACGSGELSNRLIELGFRVFSTDLVYRGFGKGGVDFLKQNSNFDGYILTNPPYKYAKEFVEHALKLTDKSVFMFLKLQFLEGKARRKLFNTGQLKTVYVSSSRILCAKNGDFEKMIAGGGSAVAYGWFEFQRGYKGDTTIKWIN